jgi:hypothetical protein
MMVRSLGEKKLERLFEAVEVDTPEYVMIHEPA